MDAISRAVRRRSWPDAVWGPSPPPMIFAFAFASAFAGDPPAPAGCTSDIHAEGLRSLTCGEVALIWGAGAEHGQQGAVVLADPILGYPVGVSARAPVRVAGATAAATAIVSLPGIEPRRVVLGHGSDWMVSCSTLERAGALARCLELIAASAPPKP